MIELFNINNFIIDTSKFSNLLHDPVVEKFENQIAKYVGAKYAVSFNSATSAIFLALLGERVVVDVPSIIPPVVLNAIITSGNKYRFIDNIDWVGDSYVLHEFDNYKIVDSAQKLEKRQFTTNCNDNDLMLFSFYPTKPVGSCDGGMIVSNNESKISHLRELALNGMCYAKNNWERVIKFPGYKMYMNSVQAQIAQNNLDIYEEKIESLSKLKKMYNAGFGKSNTSDHVYRLNVKDRDTFIAMMKASGIVCGIHYLPQHINPVYKQENEYCPKSLIEGMTTVSIPFHEKLTEEQSQFVINTVMESGLLI